jgi:choline-sulfatase
MSKRPNVIFILTDDQGYWALGCAGNKEIRTSNIDKLAETGIRFENFFCTSPVCSPARASLLTGRTPSQHGVHDWIRMGNGEKNDDVPIEYLEGITGYTELMASHGYTCGISGKWHLGAAAYPQKGFSHWFVTLGGGSTYHDVKMYRGRELVQTKGYSTDVITDDAISFIDECCDKSADKPFYLNIAYQAPHSPLVDQHPEEYVNYYLENCTFDDVPQDPRNPWIQQKPVEIQFSESLCSKDREYLTVRDLLAGYYAAIQGVDNAVGKIVQKLEDRGIRDNTLIVFMSDNGFNCGQHGIWGKGNCTAPLNLYDTSVKVPCIFNFPGRIKQGIVNDSLLSAYDFMPTLLDIAGIDNPTGDELPGKSFLAAIESGTDKEYQENDMVYAEYGPARMVRTKEWKYIHRYPYGPDELYDLVHDPKEKFNLLYENRYFIYGPKQIEEKAVEMRKYLEDWFDRFVNRHKDGRLEPVYGRGQLMKVGPEAEGRLTFHPLVSVEYKRG